MRREAGSASSDDISNRVIKSAPKTMHSIADGEADFGWQWIDPDLNSFMPALSIFLKDEVVEVSLDISSPVVFDLCNVSVGPLKL